MAVSKSQTPDGFAQPTSLPEDSEQARRWQEANRTWWEEHPMRYDWNQAIESPEFSREFFEQIDRRSFSSAHAYMPWARIPFDPLIEFDSLRDKDVLEIGVGGGSHAALLARHARSFTGIDLTDYAVKSTSERFSQFGLTGSIRRMDAEQMEFEDESFDLIWSWGVIHHSANTRRVLEEMRRVLRPGGKATTMVYQRNLWNYYVAGGLFRGVLKGDLLKTRSLHQTVQRYTDGAIARHYSAREWKQLASEFFRVERILVFGLKAELLPIPASRLKSSLLTWIPDPVSRFFTNRLGFGQFLVSDLRR
jgi:ubiquinone/menaquinone biosynthesis C-methylase UbiE